MHSSRPTHLSSDLYFGGGRDIELLTTKSVLQLYMKLAPTYKRFRDNLFMNVDIQILADSTRS